MTEFLVRFCRFGEWSAESFYKTANASKTDPSKKDDSKKEKAKAAASQVRAAACLSLTNICWMISGGERKEESTKGREETLKGRKEREEAKRRAGQTGS